MTYRREIILSLCLKAAGLALLQQLLFADAGRPAADARSTARHVLPVTGDGASRGGDHDR